MLNNVNNNGLLQLPCILAYQQRIFCHLLILKLWGSAYVRVRLKEYQYSGKMAMLNTASNTSEAYNHTVWHLLPPPALHGTTLFLLINRMILESNSAIGSLSVHPSVTHDESAASRLTDRTFTSVISVE